MKKVYQASRQPSVSAEARREPTCVPTFSFEISASTDGCLPHPVHEVQNQREDDAEQGGSHQREVESGVLAAIDDVTGQEADGKINFARQDKYKPDDKQKPAEEYQHAAKIAHGSSLEHDNVHASNE
jgi:hypothetical protein